jgi:uncharacterized protein (TIGR02270 family)
MTHTARPAIHGIVLQHLDDAAHLRSVRALLLRAPHVTLRDIDRTDERLSAHLDGLFISGDAGAQLSRAALEVPAVGQIFVSAVLAIEQRDMPQIERLLSLMDAVPDAARALSSAFGWVAPASLRGVTAQLLAAELPSAKCLGVAACALHRVDPGAALAQALAHPHGGLAARALQAAGELGRVDLLPICLDRLKDDAPTVAWAAARASLLLGDRGAAAQELRSLAMAPGPVQLDALALALFTSDPEGARALVKQLAAQGAPLRTLIKAAGWSGDSQVVPWLFKHMESSAHARLAGEAFSFITGADLTWLHLDRNAPQGVVAGPTDDPNDENVALDEDENLAWPDPPKLSAWWRQNAGRFPAGTRLFAGAPPTVAHCHHVLKEHPQRKRIAAALQMSLLKPGSPLFNVAAPARRQARQLSQQGA